MARHRNKFKETYNLALDMIETLTTGAELSVESVLGEQLSASRSTIRMVLARLAEQGIVEWGGRHKLVLRPPDKGDYFLLQDTQSIDQVIETAFMQRVLDGRLDIGTSLNETELARNLNVSTSAVRRFLERFSQYGLVEKQPGAGWRLNGFTKNFALELSDVRELFERRAVATFLQQPDDSPCWRKLDNIAQDHLDLLARIDNDYPEFSNLDDAFHRLLNSVWNNRFVTNFHEVISLIFHYHYQWKKENARQRNSAAISEHLEIIDALKRREMDQALNACAVHMASSRKTLLSAMGWK